MNDVLKFNGDPSLVVDYILKIFKYTLEINVVHDYSLIWIFINSFVEYQMDWIQ